MECRIFKDEDNAKDFTALLTEKHAWALIKKLDKKLQANVIAMVNKIPINDVGYTLNLSTVSGFFTRPESDANLHIQKL